MYELSKKVGGHKRIDSATVGGDSKGIKGLLIGEVMMIMDSLYTHESIIYIHIHIPHYAVCANVWPIVTVSNTVSWAI